LSVCKNPACGATFVQRTPTRGLPQVWCSTRCTSSYNAGIKKAERHARGLRPSRSWIITDEVIARVKLAYPSCAGDVTSEMVGEDAPWERFTVDFPNKIFKLDNRQLKVAS
jgi:hypothetical protein